jgi:hypothetical protein
MIGCRLVARSLAPVNSRRKGASSWRHDFAFDIWHLTYVRADTPLILIDMDWGLGLPF